MSASAGLDDLRDLCTFVGHSSPPVRLQAAKMVVALSGSASNYPLIAQTQLIEKMRAQLTDHKDIARETAKAAINFAENDELMHQLLFHNYISVSMEVLRDSTTDSDMRELLLMLLCNLTRDEKGAQILMQEGEEVEGLHMRRIIHWLSLPVANTISSSSSSGNNNNSNNSSRNSNSNPNPSILDPYRYCAPIITNISVLSSGRKLLLDSNRNHLQILNTQLNANDVRKKATYQTIKNLLMDTNNHAQILNDRQLWSTFLGAIIGPEVFLHGEEEYVGLPVEIRNLNRADKRRDTDAQIRVLVYESLLLLAKHKPSRIRLKKEKIYPILRHAHDYEKALCATAAEGAAEAKELDDFVDQLVPFFLLEEDDRAHPAIIAEQQKQERVKQIMDMNKRDEDSAVVSTSANANANATNNTNGKHVATHEEQQVHYLGDERGDEVRRRQREEQKRQQQQQQQQQQAANSSASSSATTAATKNAASMSAAAAADKDEDEDFPAVEPLGAEETARLSAMTLDVKPSIPLSAASSASAAAAKAAAEPAVAYAQPEADDDADAPPPLAEEDAIDYMNGLD